MALQPLDQNQLLESVASYIGEIKRQYGYYLDCRQGFIEAVKRIEDSGYDPANKLNLFAYSERMEPTRHISTLGQYVERNRLDGVNHVLASQVLLANIYAYWDAPYRPRISRALGMSGRRQDGGLVKKDDWFGDLRFIRDDIIHHAGIARRGNAARVDGINEGDQISFDIREIESFI